MEFNQERFLKILSELISKTKYLQNSPKHTPREDEAVNVELKSLKPYKKTLEIEKLTYVNGRSNLIIKYKGTTNKNIAFIGSHLDVVPADPKKWNFDPFKLTIKGDELYGRGTTDCLGHIALLTELFIQLSENKPKLKQTIVVVFIASEEYFIKGIGIDQIYKKGKLEFLKNSPCYWLDSADYGPTTGSKGTGIWTLKVKGLSSHSGYPENGVNAITLGNETLRKLKEYFYSKYKITKEDKKYIGFTDPTLSETWIEPSNTGTNIIPEEYLIKGDLRLTPSYNMEEVAKDLKRFVSKINLKNIPTDINQDFSKGSVEFIYEGGHGGFKANLNSNTYKFCKQAIEEIHGSSNTLASNGGLPLVDKLSEKGYDLLAMGFGREDKYHKDNESCRLSDMKKGFKILLRIIDLFE